MRTGCIVTGAGGRYPRALCGLSDCKVCTKSQWKVVAVAILMAACMRNVVMTLDKEPVPT